jgi:hypothetical protein
VRVEQITLERMNPAPYNPRIRLEKGSREYEALRRSLKEFGQVDPLVWNETTGNIVGGHQRYWIAQDEGEEALWASVVTITDPDREKALNLVLNNPAAQGRYDLEKLLELQTTLDAELMELAGFQDGEIEALMQAETIDAATDFLGLGDTPDSGGIGGSGLKGDHPHRTGTQYYEVILVLDETQRNIYQQAVNAAKAHFALDNSMEAIVALCDDFLKGVTAT